MVEFGRKLDEKMKAMLRETKENVQGTNSDGKETGTQINSVDQKEERNIQPEKNEETRIQKNEESLRNFQDIFKHSNIRIIGAPEGKAVSYTHLTLPTTVGPCRSRWSPYH